MVLSLLWIVLSIPLVTIGASTVAIYSAAAKLHRDGVHGSRAFLTTFYAKFRPATLFWIPMMLWSGILLFNLYVIPFLEGPIKGIYLGFTLIMCLLWLVLISYGIPMLAVHQCSPCILIRDVLVLAIQHPLHTVALLLCNLSPLLFLLLEPMWFFRLFGLWLILGIGGIAYSNVLILSKIIPFLAEENPQE